MSHDGSAEGGIGNPIDELVALLGSERVYTTDHELDAHSHDWSPAALLRRRSGRTETRPSCVVRPGDTAEVVTLLEWAQLKRAPLVPFGGGSGVVGAIAPRDAVVVDLANLNRILDIDEKSRIVRAQAGVTGPQLTDELNELELMLGHEPQSIAISTVGGWLATRACGQLSAGYGGIEDLVVGFEAVLPGGSVVRRKTVPRRVAGPDVASLMLGSEGCLGIITEATLRVFARPKERIDRCVRFDHMTEGVAACRALAQSGLRPTLVRLYDQEDAAVFLRKHADEPVVPLLLLSFDGPFASERAAAGEALCNGERGNDDLVAHWWAHRNDAVDEFRLMMAGEGLLGPHALIDTVEVAATWSVLRELYHAMKEGLSPEAALAGCHLSHVYPDGACLYFTLAAPCASDEAAEELLDTWWRIAMTTCLEAGGTISHHHGIGRVRAPWLAEEMGGWWEVLKAVKGSVDPHGIMNPGVLGL